MKRTFTLLAIAAFAANVSAQVISQNATVNVVSPTGSVACGVAGPPAYTSDNFYSRAFTLADYGITYDYKITNVAIGVQLANKPLIVNLNVYSLTGTYPTGATTLLSTAPISVRTENAGGVVDTGTALNQVIPAGSKFVIEVSHDGTDNQERFYLGTNATAESKPSYIKSVGCVIPTPTTTAAIGFPDAHWVMTITGVNNLGVTEIINSKNLQVYPNPVKDVLNFKMANNLKVESTELYDMAGKKVNTVNAKAIESINVAHFPKGTYVLKVKANDGNVYIQKIMKN